MYNLNRRVLMLRRKRIFSNFSKHNCLYCGNRGTYWIPLSLVDEDKSWVCYKHLKLDV